MTVTDGGSKTQANEDAALQQLMSALSGASAGGTGTGRVYMGSQPKVTRKDARTDSYTRTQVPSWMTTDEATAQYYSWKPKTQQDFLAKLKVAGLVGEDAGSIEASKIWTALVAEAANYGAIGKQVSPMDILGGYVSAAGGMESGQWKKDSTGKWEVNALTGERRYIGPQFQTQTNTRTDLTDPATARAIAVKMFQDLMGRDPGKGEIGQFATALSSAEEGNPLTETTTTEYDTTTGEAIGTNTTSSGGVSADAKAQLAENQIKKDPEYGALQAATTYQGAFDQLVYGAPS